MVTDQVVALRDELLAKMAEMRTLSLGTARAMEVLLLLLFPPAPHSSECSKISKGG